MKRPLAALLMFLPFNPVSADDSRADATLRLGYADYQALSQNDLAFGAGFGYRLTSWLASDASLSWAPQDMGDPAFSGSRTEGSLGLRLGPHLDRTSIYLAARPGFVKFGGEPVACIKIFPPPLSCALSNGDTLFATDLTGGVQVLGERALLRVEAGDRLVKYPVPVRDADGDPHLDSFWSHNFAASVSVGVRF